MEEESGNCASSVSLPLPLPLSHNMRTVTILVPQHVSAILPPLPCDDPVFVLQVYRSHGITWRGVVPLLLESPPVVVRRLLQILLRDQTVAMKTLVKRRRSCSDGKEQHDMAPGFHHRQFQSMALSSSMTIVVQPPIVSNLEDGTFASVVLRTERLLLRRQTLTAWWSTLGGGYFLCKRLDISLQLARQQKALAWHIGNIPMARQCAVNEAYNWIYAGQFRAAKVVLKALEDSIPGGEGEDKVTIRQCQAARVFAKRLQQMSKQGLKGYRTTDRGQSHHVVDDYQRIRIVRG